jgi:hypothetical protein
LEVNNPSCYQSVIPAKAGIQVPAEALKVLFKRYAFWIPAYAGMTFAKI